MMLASRTKDVSLKAREKVRDMVATVEVLLSDLCRSVA